jgi:hypothetical protein
MFVVYVERMSRIDRLSKSTVAVGNIIKSTLAEIYFELLLWLVIGLMQSNDSLPLCRPRCNFLFQEIICNWVLLSV